MSLRLETSGGTPLVRVTLAATLAVVLTAVVLALFPAAAEAQTSAPTEDRSAPSVVVRPGDSLWSISEGRLGPNASPQRVADAAERIHALNRGRIGADPDLIFVGQELSLPPALSEGPTGASAARKSAQAAEVTPRDRVAKGTTGTTGKAPKPVPRTVAGGAGAKGGEAPETAARQEAQQEAEPVGLPALQDEAAAAPVPAVRAVASNGSPTSPVASLLRAVRAEVASAASALAESFFAVAADARADGRRLLGLGVLALTLLVAALVAWKMPMRRTTRGDAERWGTSSGYYGYYGEAPPAPGTTSFFYRPGTLGGPLGDQDERDTRREAPRSPGLGRRAVFVGSSGTASSPGVARETGTPAGRGRAPRAKAKAGAVPRNGLALGVHNPEVRRAPRRARATMRARRLRPRLRQGRGVSARGGR